MVGMCVVDGVVLSFLDIEGKWLSVVAIAIFIIRLPMLFYEVFNPRVGTGGVVWRV